MGKQIKLPGGVLFDPETGEIQGGSFGRPPTVASGLGRSARHHTYTNRSNIWDRFNDFISSIGDWIADNSEMITNYSGMGLFVLSWIGFAVSIISIWISEGFIWALVAGIIGGGLFYYVSTILLGIFIIVMNAVLAVLRYLFYNAITFLIPTLLVIALWVSSLANVSPDNTATVTNPVSLQPNYYCDVYSTLNVREHPSSDAKVIGQLVRAEKVYVYSIENNFAKINHKGSVAYVSADYLKLLGGAKPLTSQTPQPANTNKTANTSPKVNAANISAKISRSWLAHNVMQNQQKGMMIHVDFYTYNMLNVSGECIVHIYDTNGRKLKHNNSSGKTGEIVLKQSFKPAHTNASFSDFKLFLPYSDLNMLGKEKTDLKAQAVLWAYPTSTQPKKLATSGWMDFWYKSLD